MDTLVYRGKELGVQCRRDCTPAAPKIFFVTGPTPPRPKQPVVWGTGKKVVYGYSSIQRGILEQNMLGPISPLTEPPPPPPAVFLTPLYTEGEKRSLRVHAATVPPPHRQYFCPGPTPPRPKQPVVWGTDKKVVYGYSITQRGILGQNMLGPISPLTAPPAVFFIPISASLVIL